MTVAIRPLHPVFVGEVSGVDTTAPLPPETVVYPGHGKDTTIGTEAPHLQE